MKDLTRAIKENSVILAGGTYEIRTDWVNRVRNSWRQKGKSDVFILKENISDSKQFIKAVVRSLPVTSPLKGATKPAH